MFLEESEDDSGRPLFAVEVVELLSVLCLKLDNFIVLIEGFIGHTDDVE